MNINQRKLDSKKNIKVVLFVKFVINQFLYKCMRYAHSCTRPDIPPREYNKDYFKTYYKEKDQCDISCFICNVKYHCYTSLTKHLNKNKDCKLKRLK